MSKGVTLIAVLVLIVGMWSTAAALGQRTLDEEGTPESFVFVSSRAELPTLTIDVTLHTHVQHLDQERTSISGDIAVTVVGDQAMLVTWYKFSLGRAGDPWEELTPFVDHDIASIAANPGQTEHTSFVLSAPAIGDTVFFFAQVYGFVPEQDTFATQDVFLTLPVAAGPPDA